jgi:hypothetical protein
MAILDAQVSAQAITLIAKSHEPNEHVHLNLSLLVHPCYFFAVCWALVSSDQISIVVTDVYIAGYFR